jgi:E3 ubiquitin-protein ligase RFWD3
MAMEAAESCSLPKKRKAEGKKFLVVQITALEFSRNLIFVIEMEEVVPSTSEKANDDVDVNTTEEEAITCNICFDAWSNTGSHRISSLKCGHFFGFSCIEKWLNSTGGNDCPTCNEKATKKDIRHHYVARLKAVDTGDRDRALDQVEALRRELRSLELEHATIKVTNHLQREEIDKLKAVIKSMRDNGLSPSNASSSSSSSQMARSSSSSSSDKNLHRLNYVKRLELMRPDPNNTDANKACRVLAYNETYGMLVVSQPSFTALAPGFGVRRVHMLDKKLESFVSLHKEPIRDLAFNPVKQDQLLSVSQDKTIRLTNISSCAEIQRFTCDSEVWSCCWNTNDPHVFFAGTKRSQILVYDMREVSTQPKAQIEFPIQERRPIIGLAHVPKCDSHRAFPCSGLLVMTLGSLWFFEERLNSDGEMQYNAHKLSVDGLFWSMYFHEATRLLMVSTRPTPHARHMVVELSRLNVSEDATLGPDYHIVTSMVFDHRRGGSFKERAFLRSALCQKPGGDEGQIVALYGRGSAQTDHRLIVQEVGSDKVLQEIPIERPILDICPLTLNSDHVVTILTETELHIYKWT